MRRGRRASLRRVGSPPSTHTVCLVFPTGPRDSAPKDKAEGRSPRRAARLLLELVPLESIWPPRTDEKHHGQAASAGCYGRSGRLRRTPWPAAPAGPWGRRLRSSTQSTETHSAERQDARCQARLGSTRCPEGPALRGDDVTCETVAGPPAATPREDTPPEHASERGGATELGPRGRGRPRPCPRAAGTGQAACTAGRRARRPRHTPSRGSPRSENTASSVPSSRFLSLLPLEDALVLSGGCKSPCLGRSVVIYEDHCSTHSSSETTFWERSVICKEIRDFQPNQGEGPFLASISLRSPRPWGGKLTPLPRGLQNGKANFCWHLPTTSSLGVARAGSQP